MRIPQGLTEQLQAARAARPVRHSLLDLLAAACRRSPVFSRAIDNMVKVLTRSSGRFAGLAEGALAARSTPSA